MLQQNSVNNLQEENSRIRIAQPNQIDPIVYSENTIITTPPRHQPAGPVRKPLPISTIQYGDPRLPGITSFIPRSGLDFLFGIPSIHIEQTLELHDSTTTTSENRFIVRSATNEAIFGASESSTKRDRTILGALRPFSIHLLDKTHQEAASFRRKFRMGMYFLHPQCIEVWAPPGDLLGKIRESLSLYSADFVIHNSVGDIVCQIEGPPKFLCTCKINELYLKVLSPDYKTQMGSITRIWNTDISTFTQNVYFTDPNLDIRTKALLIGAAFLTEYMYFQSNCWCC